MAGLHTAGCNPRRFAKVLPLLDWVGLDIKAPVARYCEITGVQDASAAYDCLAQLIAAGLPYEVRTTVEPHLGGGDLELIREELHAAGAANWRLQGCRGPI